MKSPRSSPAKTGCGRRFSGSAIRSRKSSGGRSARCAAPRSGSGGFGGWRAPGGAGLPLYVPGKPIEEVERELGISAIKLASNENALGPSPKAIEAVARCLAQSNRYPDAGGFYLRKKLAARLGVEMDQIVLGAGSTELIQLLCHIYIQPGDVGLTSEGTFVMFPLAVRAAGGTVVQAPLKDYAYDLDALAARLDESVRAV